MSERKTLKEFYFQALDDYVRLTPEVKNYVLPRLINDCVPFIFTRLKDNLDSFSDIGDRYPKLLSFLTKKYKYVDASQFQIFIDVDKCVLMDVELLMNYGERKISNAVQGFYSMLYPYMENAVVDWDIIREHLTNNILSNFGDRWEEYISSLEIEYNPIHNYDMEENEKVNSKITTHDDNTDSSVGFNIADVEDASPVALQNAIITTEGKDNDNKRHLERSGNIGVTTSQQMLESEIKLRDENVIVKRLIEDVVSYITLSIY